ncbi:hypothetical protein GYMLUDRAFT_365884 [Collybiopsis luxurians FD-317 M1]|nr:hypothetical protein GYMLUDRAFT_365884 [Collybiopsis luxurians FD-317 M1]
MKSQNVACFRHNKCYFARLPVELQTQIFLDCVPQPFGSLMDGNQAPQVLLSVCKNWRDVAYSTSSLWSSFEVRFGTWALNFKDPGGDAVLITRMRLWLCRSRNYPLSVKLTYEPGMPFPQHKSLSRLPVEALTLLVQHCARWRHVQLSMPNAFLAPLGASDLHLPLLNTLILNPSRLSSIWSETLDVRGLVSNCGQLTRLHVNLQAGRSLTLDDCLVILSQNPNLTACTLYTQCSFEGSHTIISAADSETLVLPALSELHLILYSNQSQPESFPETALANFLGRLELYDLKSLHIEWLLSTNGRAWTYSHPAFVTFLESLKPSLETIRLGYLPYSEAQLIDCLEALPFLTNVELLFGFAEEAEGSTITDTFWNALTLGLLPLVQSLNVQCHGCGCSEQEVVRFIDARADAELQQFRSLTLRTQVPILRMDSLQQEITHWSKRGIEVCA